MTSSVAQNKRSALGILTAKPTKKAIAFMLKGRELERGKGLQPFPPLENYPTLFYLIIYIYFLLSHGNTLDRKKIMGATAY